MLAAHTTLTTLQKDPSTDRNLEQQLKIARVNSALNAASTMRGFTSRTLSEARRVENDWMRIGRLPSDRPWGNKRLSLLEFVNHTVYELNGL
jgi:hypothetical protein